MRHIRDILPHLFKARGRPTNADPSLAMSDIACPSCSKKRSWRILSTRTLKTTKDIKRHAQCLNCAYAAIFMERMIKGEPVIVLSPDDNEAELLSRIEKLTQELDAQKPSMVLLDRVWELVEPGSRNMDLDAVYDKLIARAGGGEAGAEDIWGPVRKMLGGMLDEKTPATPEAVADAIDAVLTPLRIDVKRAMDDAKEYHSDRQAAIRHLEAAGAKKTGDGWAWPFFDADGEAEYMPVHEWLRRRKDAAKALAANLSVNGKTIKPDEPTRESATTTTAPRGDDTKKTTTPKKKASDADKRAKDAERKRKARAKKSAEKAPA